VIDTVRPAARSAAAEPPAAGDLALAPVTRLLWRGPSSIHLELGDRAVVVDGLAPSVVARIAARRPPREPLDAPDDLTDALGALAEGGFLWRRAGSGEDLRLAPPTPQLAGQLAALVPRRGEAAARVLAARRLAGVEISGESRLMASIAAVLAAAGVGRISCRTDRAARQRDVVPGGVAATDEGQPLARAVAAAVRRAAPATDITPHAPGELPDLTVVATETPLSDDRVAALQASGGAYLLVRLDLDAGVVGPLVLPGTTSCPGCADRHRLDRDPAWDALAAQLAIGGRGAGAADVAVATTIAGVAAQQALAYLDGEHPATVDGTLELRLPDWRLRRRSWAPHPRCSCGAT
jgi:bacteriocin biosynthesis cyclodehydratase domain-containing protein